MTEHNGTCRLSDGSNAEDASFVCIQNAESVSALRVLHISDACPGISCDDVADSCVLDEWLINGSPVRIDQVQCQLAGENDYRKLYDEECECTIYNSAL